MMPQRQANILVEAVNRRYQSKDYSFNRFERLAVMNALHWQHILMLYDELLLEGSKMDVFKDIWTDKMAASVSENMYQYREDLFTLL
jgi:hypothetical protein